jgi:hypothetical protein
MPTEILVEDIVKKELRILDIMAEIRLPKSVTVNKLLVGK